MKRDTTPLLYSICAMFLLVGIIMTCNDDPGPNSIDPSNAHGEPIVIIAQKSKNHSYGEYYYKAKNAQNTIGFYSNKFYKVGDTLGRRIDTFKLFSRDHTQQNFHSFAYIDWPEEIVDISRVPEQPTVLEAYLDGDSIFLRIKRH